MSKQMEISTLDIAARKDLIRSFTCFSTLNEEQLNEFAQLMQEVHFAVAEKLVIEDDIVSNIGMIVRGAVEVTHAERENNKTRSVPLATLRAGESIGLSETGFFSDTGKCTATVTALTDVDVLQISIKALEAFLHSHQLEGAMQAAAKQMLRMSLIKQSLPFSHLSPERLQWLATKIEEIARPAGSIIFKQGDEGDKCYLICAGQIEIVTTDEQGNEKSIACLKSPVMFGEATLITATPRNATARVKQDCHLLVLDHHLLSELIESEHNVAKTLMSLMVDRSRPLQNSEVTLHERHTADGQVVSILKNTQTDHYFKLSSEGLFIWKQLDGKHTLREITLNLADKYSVFAPDVVAALISKLTRAGFVKNLSMNVAVNQAPQALWVRAMTRLRCLLEVRKAFGDSDKWVTSAYQKIIKYFFSKAGLIILSVLIVTGLISFIVNTSDVLLFFSVKHVSLILLLGLVPLSYAEVLLHELGHAFAVKAYNREVHYMGVGWYWFFPIAFTDTSDMWLAARKPRIIVNLAGVFVDILVAGVAALLILVIANPYIQGMLWLFALYTYLSAFRMLSPMQEMDGYYVLVDWLEKNRLRQSAVIWLVKKFPQAIRQPSLFKENWPEVIYWLACIAYLILVSLLTLAVQTFVFSILGIQAANPYLVLIMPFMMAIFTSFSIIADIKSQAEE